MGGRVVDGRDFVHHQDTVFNEVIEVKMEKLVGAKSMASMV